MGWRDRFKASGEGSASKSSTSTMTSWVDADIEAIRAATSEVAGQPIDLSYITDAYMASRFDVPYSSEGGEDFEAAQADAVIATYGGAPLSDDHRYVWYGHHAALLDDGTIKSWFFLSVTYKDDEFKPGTQLFRCYGKAMIVGRLDDGSPLWEFRI